MYDCQDCGETDPTKFYISKGGRRCKPCTIKHNKARRQSERESDQPHSEAASSGVHQPMPYVPMMGFMPAPAMGVTPASVEALIKTQVKSLRDAQVALERRYNAMEKTVTSRLESLNDENLEEHPLEVGTTWRDNANTRHEESRLLVGTVGNIETRLGLVSKDVDDFVMITGRLVRNDEARKKELEDLKTMVDSKFLQYDESQEVDNLKDEVEDLKAELLRREETHRKEIEDFNAEIGKAFTRRDEIHREEIESIKSERASDMSSIEKMFSELRNELDGYKRELAELKARPSAPVYKPPVMPSYPAPIIPKPTTPVQAPSIHAPMSYQPLSPKPTSFVGFGGGPGGYPLYSTGPAAVAGNPRPFPTPSTYGRR